MENRRLLVRRACPLNKWVCKHPSSSILLFSAKGLIMYGIIKLYNHWGFLECEHSIGRYYRSLFKLTFGIKLERPSNEEHITIVSPDDGLLLSNMHGFNGQKLEFELLPTLWHNESAVWLDVISTDIAIFRRRLGLLSSTDLGLHFCIGYIHD